MSRGHDSVDELEPVADYTRPLGSGTRARSVTRHPVPAWARDTLRDYPLHRLHIGSTWALIEALDGDPAEIVLIYSPDVLPEEKRRSQLRDYPLLPAGLWTVVRSAVRASP